ncbi:MAG: hypothetical protein EZS28_020452, partial [Streblomastix strix]
TSKLVAVGLNVLDPYVNVEFEILICAGANKVPTIVLNATFRVPLLIDNISSPVNVGQVVVFVPKVVAAFVIRIQIPMDVESAGSQKVPLVIATVLYVFGLTGIVLVTSSILTPLKTGAAVSPIVTSALVVLIKEFVPPLVKVPELIINAEPQNQISPELPSSCNVMS